jgi:SpoIID/LytB domain protein
MRVGVSRLLVIFVLVAGAVWWQRDLFVASVNAAGCDEAIKNDLDELEYQRKKKDCMKALEDILTATSNLENAVDEIKRILNNLAVNLEAARAGVVKKKEELADLNKRIGAREEDLALQEKILAQRVRSLYIRSHFSSPPVVLLALGKSSEATLELAMGRALSFEDKKVIASISAELARLTSDKEKAERLKNDLERQEAELAQSQKDYEAQAAFFAKEIAGAKAYRAKLEQRIAAITSKQQQLLAEKLASLHLPTSLGAGPLYCTDDRRLDPGFSPAFAFYTFGIPHRVGMNQYGAFGRARAGQNAETILNAYFNDFDLKKDYSTDITIQVEGYGGFKIEDYVKRIYEMPESWGSQGAYEALKAQAVAARTYALAYTNNGEKPICATQNCQVFKAEEKGGDWNRAVEETRGWVMVQGGRPISAWYASTAGGYTFRSDDVGWRSTSWTKRLRDTSGEVNSFADLFARAYDKDSPCFYAAQGWRSEYGKSAWLKASEVADIVNVLILAKNDASTQKHLSQVDKPNPDGVETWDAERVKQELRRRGFTPFNNVSGLAVDWDRGAGRTTAVRVRGDAGEMSFDGSEFKDFFNLRAPANIQIVGPLYNVETR